MTIKRIPFAIASDEAVSQAYSRQRLLNLFAERAQTGAQSPVLILGRWGLKPWGTAGGGPIRGSSDMGGVLYVVSGDKLYSVDSDGDATEIGTVAGTGFVTMANNGAQLAIATGTAWVDYIKGFFLWGWRGEGKAYLYNVTTAAFGEISDTDLFLEGNGKFQWSEVDDGSDYDALQFASADASPDNLIRGIVDRADVFLFGEKSIEPWYLSGSDTVFDPQNQAVIPKGVLGMHAVERLDNTVIWVGTDPLAGGPVVYHLVGMEAQRLSTHAVEKGLSAVTDWSLVRCIAYVLNGHSFFHIILADNVSWVYDRASQLWHEETTSGLSRWQGNSHTYVYSKNIVGSCNSGDLFELSQTHYFDGEDAYIEREMISVPIGDNSVWRTLGLFQLDMETGVGLSSGQGSDPQVMISYSKDRGRNWCNEKLRSAGLIGDYARRVICYSLGRFRSIMFKVRITDPVKVAFIDYFADIL